MLEVIGAPDMETLISETIPDAIRLDRPLNLPAALNERDYLRHMRARSMENEVWSTYIGLGYNPTVTPAVIRRNILENPGWYTPYTPYQAEIAQGRLAALLNFQTAIIDMTALPIANASLLDEGTAAAEAMLLFFHELNKRKVTRPVFWVDAACLPQTINVVQTKAEPLGIKVKIAEPSSFEVDESCFGALLQYPGQEGQVEDPTAVIESVKAVGGYVAMACDLLSLAMLKAPGELGADAAVGSAQRFGVPMFYGGPHAAFFATKDEFKRKIPGRIIGVSVDAEGNRALRMALQTREQHIRREKATSNICTAQALLAGMAGMYAVWHGEEGIRTIASTIHRQAVQLSATLTALGFKIRHKSFFDTLCVDVGGSSNMEFIRDAAENAKINLRYFENGDIGISLNECTSEDDIRALIDVFADSARGSVPEAMNLDHSTIPAGLQRKSNFLSHPVFSSYRSETEMMRYIKKLENRDIGLTHSMIPLGSCTMKLNAASELDPVSYPGFAELHPFAPKEQTQGYAAIISDLEKYLCEITRFDACSLQPNSGAQGEYAGLMVIRAYHLDRGDDHRNVVLIPSSAHGTNPASAVMAGMKVVVVACDEQGNIMVDDLKAKAEEHKENLSALMVTYPSTHGVFETSIMEICQIVHDCGGMVYMDGANMNAQVGLTSPASIGADVCHLNLHKTFAIPHGGGGPGMGPICCNDKLAPFLPAHNLTKTGGEKGIGNISAAPWGSAAILLISYGYIRMLGAEGCTDATEYAILNANYLKSRLAGAYEVLYTGVTGRVAHEFILDFRDFKASSGVSVEDVAKRLIDFGFHAPTVSFPVAGTIMIEPTESESREELDRFTEALLAIREEIQEIADGKFEQDNNALHHAPHTQALITADEWDRPYPRSKAAFPLTWVREAKMWASVARIDNGYGDRNLICACPPIESYEEEASLAN